MDKKHLLELDHTNIYERLTSLSRLFELISNYADMLGDPVLLRLHEAADDIIAEIFSALDELAEDIGKEA